MTTYTIVDKDKDPLGPGEVNSGQTFLVSDGDTYIIDASVNDHIIFEADGGLPASFDISFTGSNANSFDITVKDDLAPTVTVPDNADLSDVNFKAANADAVEFTAGNNISFGKYEGSNTSADTITIGDGFTATDHWDTKGGDDVIVIGNNSDFKDFKTGSGDDHFTVGDDAMFSKIETQEGNDTVRIGDRADVSSDNGADIDGGKVKTGDGDDTIYLGKNAQANEFDGGSGNDTFNTQTTGTSNKNMETTNVVCYAPGTLIDTPDGQRAVEDLCVGDLVTTLDHGPKPILWTRSADHALEEVEQDSKPVMITAGALGNGRPVSDLIVSPQHRIFLGGCGQLDDVFETESFAPAKALTALQDIHHMKGTHTVTWVHFACERHEVVTANGCLSESLLLGPIVMTGLTSVERQELYAIYGDALTGPAARICHTVGDVQRRLSAKLKSRKWDDDLEIEQQESELLRFVKSAKMKRAAFNDYSRIGQNTDDAEDPRTHNRRIA